jgi:Fe-S cluster assembly protein SufD
LQDRRRAAHDRLETASLPTEAEEVWRYSRIGELDMDVFAPADGREPEHETPPGVEALLEAIGPRAGLLALRNGRVVRAELDPEVAAKGVHLGGLDAVADDPDMLGGTTGGSDLFTNLNTAFLPDAAVVQVPAGVAIDAPIVVVHWLSGDGAAVFPRTIVHAGEASEVTVYEHMGSDDVRALAVPVVELRADQAATIRYESLQQLGPRVWQVGYQSSRVARDATVVTSVIALGGDYARVRVDSKLEGIGGTSKMLAVYFGDGQQVHDFRTMQDHDAPKSTSDLLFKGAVADHASSVYTGLIRVKKGAAGTKAYQTNRNLVLDEGASANSVPNLEIEENDVSCSHASAVGPIDEEQRYYLESRGIPTDVADRLIVLGFFEDVIEATPVPGLRPILRQAIADKLDQVRP